MKLPRAVLAGFAVTTFGSRTYLTQRSKHTRWRWDDTPAESELTIPNFFVPAGTGATAAAAQATLRSKFAGASYFFGRAFGGWLPSDGLYPLADDAASISPLSLAARRGLPPILLFSAEKDSIVPCGQQERFAEVARASGNTVSQLVFMGDVDHGEGGLYTQAGRQAALRFLHATGILRGGMRHVPSSERHIIAAQRALGLKVAPFEPDPFRWWRDKRRTLRLSSSRHAGPSGEDA